MSLLSLDRHTLAYDHVVGSDVCVIFCAGFNSNRFGNKARALMIMCQEVGWEYICFDYSGHGESGGDFGDGSISVWLDDTLAIVDEVTMNKKVILVGSSMGGWLALLAALARPEKVCGLMLIACAADMTRFYPTRLKDIDPQKDAKSRTFYSVPNEYDDQQPYRVYENMILDGERWCLLDKDIQLSVPVRLIHGMQDDVVEWQRSQAVVEKLISENVVLHLVKGGDHRLSTDEDLRILRHFLLQLAEQIGPALLS